MAGSALQEQAQQQRLGVFYLGKRTLVLIGRTRQRQNSMALGSVAGYGTPPAIARTVSSDFPWAADINRFRLKVGWMLPWSAKRHRMMQCCAMLRGQSESFAFALQSGCAAGKFAFRCHEQRRSVNAQLRERVRDARDA